MLLAMFTWALASPAGSSPDDNFHLASIWCGQSDRAELCSTAQNQYWEVPSSAYEAASCFAYHPEIGASCQDELLHTSSGLVPAPHSNQDHSYPPGFYSTLSIFASKDVSSAVLVIRSFNICLLILTSWALYRFSPQLNRRPLLWGMIFTFVPLGMFIIPSTNPSSWALISAATYWVALKGFLETKSKQRTVLGLIALLTAVIGASARADSSAFILLATVIVIIQAGPIKLKSKSAVLLLFAIICVVALSIMNAGQISSLQTGLSENKVEVLNSKYGLPLWLINLVAQPWLWTGVAGTWPLGWLDTPLPIIVPISTVLAAFSVIIWTVRKNTTFGQLHVIIAWTALVLAPFIILMRSNALIGTEVQPRYILPLITLAFGVTFLSSGNKRVPNWLIWLATISLSVGNSFALYATMQRYIFGTINDKNIFTSAPEWWWHFAPTPMATWVIGSFAFCAGIYILLSKTQSAIVIKSHPESCPPSTSLSQ